VCCTYYTAKGSSDDKTEADSNDITEHPHDDKPRSYLCTVCDKRFTRKYNLNVHKQVHTSAKLYSCSQCEKRFKTLDCLKRHMNVHSSKYKCTECGKCFQHNQELTVHRRSHSGEKRFECTVCSKRFTTSSDLVVHRRIHSGEKPHKCQLCDKTFTQSGDLNRHMRVHTGDKPYTCSLCNKSFSESGSLQRHKRFVPSNRRPYDCRYCGMLCKSRGDLKRHVRTHTGVKPYLCGHCSERFTQHWQLRSHLLKSHNEGTWFTCHICEKKFCHLGNLKAHILRRHEGVKPYVCRECLKCFCTASELKHHALKHSDIKHFCCGKCGKFFKYKEYVKIHFNRCSGVVPFSDIFCDKWETKKEISVEFDVNRGDTGREVTVNTRSNTEVSNTWHAGHITRTFSDLPERWLSTVVWRRSLSAAFCRLKDLCLQMDLQQHWGLMFCGCWPKAVEQPFSWSYSNRYRQPTVWTVARDLLVWVLRSRHIVTICLKLHLGKFSCLLTSFITSWYLLSLSCRNAVINKWINY